MITCQNDILEKWKEYSKQLLNYEEPIDSFVWIDVESNENEYLPPSRMKITQQGKKLKNHKTQDEVGIQSRVSKSLD